MNVVSRSSLWRIAKRETEEANPSQSMDDYDDTTFEPSYQDAPNRTDQKTAVDSNSGMPTKLKGFSQTGRLSQTQFNELVQSVTSENGSFSRLEQKVDKLEAQLAKVIDTNSKIMTAVRKLTDKMQRAAPKTEFPCKSIQELDAIELKVAADPPKYVELFRTILQPEGVRKNLNRILSTSVLMDMNYSGTCSKTGLSSYVSLNSALYESQRADGYTFGDYARDVRTAFSKMKNRVYKDVSKIKKMRREEMEMAENCDGDTNFKTEMT